MYKKTYANSSVAADHYNHFLNKLATIDQRNALDPTSQVHGVTKFSDLSESVFRSRYLGKKSSTSVTSSLSTLQAEGMTVNDVTDHYLRIAKELEEKRLGTVTSVDWYVSNIIWECPV